MRALRLAWFVLARVHGAGLPCGAVVTALARVIIKTVLEGVEKVNAGLGPLAGEMEKHFLESGAALERLTVESDRLVTLGEELVRLATGQDEAEKSIGETMAVLERPLAYLGLETEAIESHVADLQGSGTLVGRLLDCEARLQYAVAPLRVIQTLFRVESSRLPDSARDAFGSLTARIEQLHQQVSESFRAQFERLSGTRTTLDSVTKRIDRELRCQRQVLEAKQRHIREATQKLTGEIERNSGRDLALTAHGRCVSESVHRMIIALQNQDISAQRIGHVIDALRSLEDEMDLLDRGESLSDPVDLARWRAVLDIQTGQLQGVEDALLSTAEEVSRRSSGILTTIEVLDNECVFLREFSAVTAAANGTIQVLLEIIEEVRKLARGSVQLVRESAERIEQVQQVAGEMTASVEELSYQMNMVALNAQIQAVEIGSGTGLEILAASTAAIATETTHTGEMITADLSRFRQGLAESVEAFRKLATQGGDELDYLDGPLAEHERRLHSVRDRMLALLRQIAEAVDNVRRVAAEMAAGMERDRPVRQALSTSRVRLEEAIASLAAAVGGDPVEVHQLTESGYTMATERDNHRAVIGRITGEMPLMARAGDTAEDSGVELF